jgi:hypothetical protein
MVRAAIFTSFSSIEPERELAISQAASEEPRLPHDFSISIGLV